MLQAEDLPVSLNGKKAFHGNKTPHRLNSAFKPEMQCNPDCGRGSRDCKHDSSCSINSMQSHQTMPFLFR